MVSRSGLGLLLFGHLLNDGITTMVVILLYGVLHVTFVHLGEVEEPLGWHADRSRGQLGSRRPKLNSGDVVAAAEAGRVPHFRNA